MPANTFLNSLPDKNDKKYCYINDLTVAALAVGGEPLSVGEFPDRWEYTGYSVDFGVGVDRPAPSTQCVGVGIP
jgi:hypothetical protein